MESKLILDFKDRNGKRTIWTEENFITHAKKHPELKVPGMLERIIKTVCQPDLIMPSHQSDTRECFYTLEYSINGQNRYTKVVIQNGDKVNEIVTAFRPDHIKENQYNLEPIWKVK